jgi:peptidyl-prolyl cis-trans isomerase SurA
MNKRNVRRQVIMKRPLVQIVLALTVLAGLAHPLAAGPFSPIKFVNNQAITQFEYDQRLLFMTMLRQPGDLEKLALDSLVDDRLRLFAAKQYDVKLTPDQIKTGMEEFASRANLTADKFIEIVGAAGVQPQTFRDFVESGLVWREMVRGKYSASITISEKQIDRAMESATPMVAISVRLSEIVLPATGAGRDAALVAAQSLRLHLRAGEDFATLARANSKGATAGSGGALDWMKLSQMKPDAAVAVRALQPGQVSDPVILDESVVIYQMQEQKQEPTTATGTVVDYAEFLLPDDGSAAAVRTKVDTCNDLYTLAKGLPAERLIRETVPQAQVPSDISGALAGMDAGESSTALTKGGWRVFLMLCRRGPAESDLPSRDEVKMQLTNQQLSTQAEIFLEELRSEAIIRTP